MGNVAFNMQSTITSTMKELIELSIYEERFRESNPTNESQTEKSIQDTLNDIHIVIQKQKDRIIELADTLDITNLYKEIYNIKLYYKSENNCYIDYVNKVLQDIIVKKTGEPYVENEKMLRRMKIEHDLPILNSEIAFFKQKRYSAYAPPECAYLYEQSVAYRDTLLKELQTVQN